MGGDFPRLASDQSLFCHALNPETHSAAADAGLPRSNNATLPELLRSAFPWRRFVAVWHSGIRFSLVIGAVHKETWQICFVRGGNCSRWSSRAGVTGQCSSSSRNVQSRPHGHESALHLFTRRGCTIQSAEYKCCVAIWEELCLSGSGSC